MHKVCHCSWGGGGEGEVLPGRKMNETEAIFSFCFFFSQDEFVKKKKKKEKIQIDLKRL